MLKLVLDTDIVIAALRSPSGASAAILDAAYHEQCALLATVPMMLEYEAIGTRGEHIEASGLQIGEIQTFLDALAVVIEPVETYFMWRGRLLDADDEFILEAAINGRADAIVTFNTRDFGAVPKQFGIELWKPGEVIERIRV
jgi:putative PIN family toxin of toxin-antitoxin system